MFLSALKIIQKGHPSLALTIIHTLDSITGLTKRTVVVNIALIDLTS